MRDARMNPVTLPDILETKETLAGIRKTFRCRVVERGPGDVVVLFISDRPMSVPGLVLPAGTVAFGYFWVDRPYNVYHWMTPDGATLGHYFNLASHTRIDEESLCWRDLVIDLLVATDGTVAVLDEDELPPQLDPSTRVLVDGARQAALVAAERMPAELEARSSALWPRVFPGSSR